MSRIIRPLQRDDAGKSGDSNDRSASGRLTKPAKLDGWWLADGDRFPLRRKGSPAFCPREGRYLFLGEALGPASSSLAFGRMLRPRIRAELTSSADARWLLNLFLPSFLGATIAMAGFSSTSLAPKASDELAVKKVSSSNDQD
jgi:hypothetical protein